MADDFRSLCAGLLAIFDKYDGESNLAGILDDMRENGNDVIERTRAALKDQSPTSKNNQESNSPPSVKISTTVLADDFVIQEMIDLAGRFTRKVLDTQEQQIKQALISLGWTPPTNTK